MRKLRINIVYVVSWLGISILFGVLTKLMDSVPFLGNLFTREGVWVLLATCIAAYSKTLMRASVNTFLFFTGMLIGYYMYTMHLFGAFPTRYIVFWGSITLASPFLAAIVWLAKNNKRLCYVLPALPMGYMLNLSVGMGWDYFYLKYIEELILFFIMSTIFYRTPKQMAVLIGLTLAIAFFVRPTIYF